jgi:hypothetical protein
MKITTINELFPKMTSGEITAKEAVEIAIENKLEYALEYFSPQTDVDLPYWDMREIWLPIKKAREAEEKIRLEAYEQAHPVEMTKCSCGHTVPSTLVMNASLGSSCPDCYDRMSD